MESKVKAAFGEREKYLKEILKERASYLLKRYARGGPPYDPHHIADGMGVEVRECDLNGIDGFVEVVEGKYVASISKRINVARQRLTLGHELCHVLLMQRADDGKPLPLVRYRTKGKLPALHQDPQEEALCNHFAGELLMPSGEVSTRINNHPLTPRTVFKLANTYQVSTQAAIVQLLKVVNRKKFGFVFWNLESLWPMPLWWYGLKTTQRSELQMLESIAGSSEDYLDLWETFGGQRQRVKIRCSPTPERRFSMMVIKLCYDGVEDRASYKL
jgi:hypothetical protein